MLRSLSLQNYRAFKKLDIPLTKINFFIGPNNTGKSVILSAINLLSQTLDSADQHVTLLLNGKFEKLGTYWDMVYQHNESLDISLGLEIDVELPESRYYTDIHKIIGRTFKTDVTFHYRPQRREIIPKSILVCSPINRLLISTRISSTYESQLIEEVSRHLSNIVVGPSSYNILRLNHFLPISSPSLFLRTFENEKIESDYWSLNRILRNLSNSSYRHLQSLEFIGPFRKEPERTHSFSGETPSSVGVTGDKYIDIIASDESKRRGKKLNILLNISKWMKAAGIASEINLIPFSERHFEIWLKHIHTNQVVNIADAGYGCSQILPILVAGYNVPQNGILSIAQPEIHLHPKAEAELGTFIFGISQKPVQIFIETHSVNLLLRLQSHVASGELNAKDINVFNLYSEEKSKNIICKLIPLGQDGYFTEKWPKGFFPERLEEAKRLAKFTV